MRYRCLSCGFIYDEAVGDPENGVAAGMSIGRCQPGWLCKDCGRTVGDFTPD
jgi:rubredoxin